MLKRIRTYFEERQRRPIVKAFQEAVQALSEIDTHDSPIVSGQNYKLKPKYAIGTIPAIIHSTSDIYLGEHGINRVRGEHEGAIIGTLMPEGHKSGRSHLAFYQGVIDRRDSAVYLGPDELRAKNDANTLTPEQRETSDRFSSLAQVVLMFKGKQPVLFVPYLQKVITLSQREKRLVDRYIKVHGEDRHMANLVAVERIAKEMEKKGITPEVHVPRAWQVLNHNNNDLSHRIQRPFEQLGKRFKADELKIGNITVDTINLSRKKDGKKIKNGQNY